jgi:hypothetical protein
MADGDSKKGFGLLKTALGSGAGLATGVVGAYSIAFVDQYAKPKPVANFAVTSEGLNITCQNQSSGHTGWWDFGDGSPLEPFNSELKEVKHAYTKPGNYSVKLTVRNFLMEENDRSVPVDLTGGASSSAAGQASTGPNIANLTVEPVNSGTAPATFKVRCELKGTQQTILDLGSGAMPELLTANGVFEKHVVYEQPGKFPLQLFAMNGTKLDKKWQVVDVRPPAPGALSVVLKVSDSGSRIERQAGDQAVVVGVPQKPAGKFEKQVSASPGQTIVEAKLGVFTNKAVKSVAVAISADKTKAVVSGEWTADANAKGIPGSDVILPVNLVQERTVAIPPTSQLIAGSLMSASLFDSFDSRGADWNTNQRTATLTLPAAPAGPGAVRTVSLALHEIDGRGADRVVVAVPDLTKPIEEQAVELSNRQRHIIRWERRANGQVLVTIKPMQMLANR